MKKVKDSKDMTLAEILEKRLDIKNKGPMGALSIDEMAAKLKDAPTIESLASRPVNTGTRVANKMEQRLLKDAAKKGAKKGLGSMLGRAASIAAGPIGMLISEGADATELGTAPQDRTIESPYYRKLQALEEMKKRADDRAEMAKKKNTNEELGRVAKEVADVEDSLGMYDWEEPKKEKISNAEAIRYMLENMK